MADILSEIIANKKREVAAAQTRRSQAELAELAQKAPPPRSFSEALSSLGSTRVIAECKRQSPSRGVMRDPYDPVALAQAYQAGGAAAISVLTDERYFGGHLDHLQAVSRSVHIPVLRKDFIISEYQIYEARAHGADAFLLLSGPLNAAELETLIQCGLRLGMEALIESHNAAELSAALTTTGQIFGINNRDLKTFGIDMRSAGDLIHVAQAKVPDAIMVCESGIKTRADIERMKAVGYNVFLIGEALVTQADPTTALEALIAQHH